MLSRSGNMNRGTLVVIAMIAAGCIAALIAYYYWTHNVRVAPQDPATTKAQPAAMSMLSATGAVAHGC